jgi:hypothetical protein
LSVVAVAVLEYADLPLAVEFDKRFDTILGKCRKSAVFIDFKSRFDFMAQRDAGFSVGLL